MLKIFHVQHEFKQLIVDFKEILLNEFKDNFVSMVLYGSVARKEAKKDSDIDLCLVFNDMPRSRYKRNKIIFGSLRKLKEVSSYQTLHQKGFLAEIVPLVFTKKELERTRPILLDMVDASEIIFDDGTFKKKLQQIKKRMTELGSKKVVTKKGDWYWILKPDLKLGEVFSL